ncbi:septal ring lytic transglycosylase RlpA family protein [Wielerella bovis]|uniref:septal ring lytic transglycosylase RlpA family protein n=1 Tax=Wielerella bovis TaxID=2917790 RepID=UPI0024B84965|nr:septal ring lytic transglycosylase RlpA family protein [Wielerella bovis]
MTKIQRTLFVSVFALFAATQVHAAPAKTTRTVGHANKANVVPAEKLHPSANLSYKVAGQRYYPQTSAKNFSQTGYASWYGPGFHGRRTSSGEVFDMYAMTAAHKTLPIPSYVRVTNLSNGKKVVVRINDRGPFHGNRVLDLSKGAAAQLGFINQGYTNVKIEVLKAGDSLNHAVATHSKSATITPAVATRSKSVTATPVVAKPAANTGSIYVSIRAFENESDAKEFLQQTSEHLTKAKAEQRAMLVKRSEGYVIRVGPFKKQEQADETQDRLTQEII